MTTKPPTTLSQAAARMHAKGTSIHELMMLTGKSEREVRALIRRGGGSVAPLLTAGDFMLVPTVQAAKTHCGQCDKYITSAEGEACGWKFCKGKAA